MKLQHLHESFIEKANRPMRFGSLPISAKEPPVPIVAIERWLDVNGMLCKSYRFRRMEDRAQFVIGLLAYEAQVDHHATITLDHDQVSLRVQTKDIGKVTEVDKEYAKYADVLFRDLVTSPGVESFDGDEG